MVTFGLTKEPVTTSGGVTILPDADVNTIDLTGAAMVILPGSSQYEHDDPTQLVPLIQNCIRNTIPVAAICGATLFLANHGFLDTVRHTSCGQEWLKEHAPAYRGGEHLYEHAPSVADGGVSLPQIHWVLSILPTISYKRWMCSRRSFWNSGMVR
ncbi:DJ-1/PfpI family protein [Methanogenium cariaci]|uniref:DJ-1/PfpI family protein n=1 Tax=Methanogenium cariaci TaxID=2197 RepID=UPI001FE0617D|nr:DJ-1/PfpI family protein [Methanogenium cariaci]